MKKIFIFLFFFALSGGLTAILFVFSVQSQEGQPPVAVIEADKTSAFIGEEIVFSGANSYDPDGEIIFYQWCFGDGETAEGQTVSYNYSSAGNYDITLTIWDDFEFSDSKSISITIQEESPANQPPTSSYQVPTTGQVGENINFSSQPFDPDDNIESILWEFGDGAISDQADCSYAYQETGTFSWTLTITDDQGAQAIYSSSITIFPVEEEPEEIEESKPQPSLEATEGEPVRSSDVSGSAQPEMDEPKSELEPRPVPKKQEPAKTLEEQGAVYLQNQNQNCPEEYVQKLLTEKATLEKQVQNMEAQQQEAKKIIKNFTKQIDNLTGQINNTQQDLDINKQTLEDVKKRLGEITNRLDNLDNEINKVHERILEILNFFAHGENNISVYQGQDPLADVNSGAAFGCGREGSNTWIVIKGSAGVRQFLKISRQYSKIRQELRELEKKIRELEKMRPKLEKEKSKLEKQKTQLETTIPQEEAKLGGLKSQKTELEAEQKAEQKKLDELNQQAEELNKKIARFNELAEQCGVRAGKALTNAKEKLGKMPPSAKKAAEKEFDKQASDEEKEAYNDPYSMDESQGGLIVGKTADKLEKIMKEVSECSPGDTKKVDLEEEDREVTILKGIELIKVSNAKGIYGVSEKTWKEVVGGIKEGLNFVGEVGEAGDIIGQNPLSYLYGKYFQGPATEALINAIERLREKDCPMWIQLTYGPIWQIKTTEITNYTDIYHCKDGTWQKQKTELSKSYEQGKCEVLSREESCKYELCTAANIVGEVSGTNNNLKKFVSRLYQQEINWSYCRYCPPEAWATAVQIAIESLFSNEGPCSMSYSDYKLGKCPGEYK